MKPICRAIDRNPLRSAMGTRTRDSCRARDSKTDWPWATYTLSPGDSRLWAARARSLAALAP